MPKCYGRNSATRALRAVSVWSNSGSPRCGPQRGVEPTQRYETAPGEQAQCDWADFGALVYPDGRRPLYIFIDTMSYSRRMSSEFVHDERQETLFACLEHAFAYLGCVPATILSDNMKPMVVEHPPDGAMVWNPRFAAFAAFHGFRPKAARPYRAKTKAIDPYYTSFSVCGITSGVAVHPRFH